MHNPIKVCSAVQKRHQWKHIFRVNVILAEHDILVPSKRT